MQWLIVLHLIVLHTVDGREMIINPLQVTSIREQHEANDPSKPFMQDVRCQINMADGKFVTVVEECDVVRKMMEGR